MKNLRIYLPLVNGDQLPLNFSNGRELMHEMVSDDFGIPPRALCLEVIDNDGKTITITIPYDDRDKVFVHIRDIENVDA